MRVTDNYTHELLGYLTEISLGGFRLDSSKALKVKKDYTVRLEFTSGVADKAYVVFVARTKWIRPDPVIPGEYILGFKIVSISPGEKEVYQERC